MKKIFLIFALLASNGAFATGYADAMKSASKTVLKGMSKACSKESVTMGAKLMAVVAIGCVFVFGTVYAYGRLTGSNHKQTIKSMCEGLAMIEFENRYGF
jgi:hypothetical protein